MKYSNWSQVFANDPNSDSYDKNVVDVENLTIDTISAAKCIENIKKEPNLMYLSVEPIIKDVQIIHHLTAIGGNIAMLETIFVAISGFGNFFVDTKEFKVPSLAIITRLSNASNVATTTTKARDPKLKFCHIITLPPFLSKTVIASILKTPAKLIVKLIMTIKVFDTTHATDAPFSSAIDACRRIL